MPAVTWVGNDSRASPLAELFFGFKEVVCVNCLAHHGHSIQGSSSPPNLCSLLPPLPRAGVGSKLSMYSQWEVGWGLGGL